LVKNGEIVGEGFHKKAGEGHAEVNAIAQAKESTVGATAYVTLEPCSHFGRTPPCAQGLIDAQISHVVIAMVDPNPKVSGRGIEILHKAGIKTQVGLLEADAQALNIGFIKLMQDGLPYVRCKLAASLDGKTAMASGESKWITSAEARRDVQRLRAQSCAIICGADSVIIDQAKMTVRWSELGELAETYPEQEVRQPIRIVIDSQNRLKPNDSIFNLPFPIIIVRTAIENLHQWPHFVEQVICSSIKDANDVEKVDLPELLALLGKRGLNDVFIESGATLAGVFIAQDLVDELVLYQAPKLMGTDGKGLVSFPNIDRLAQAKALKLKEVSMVGPDIKIVANFYKQPLEDEN
jgi:diaminohydroxyphosphoribosylaminopyrimidine deaminase/5-amino-6-(5-phosphoribosylamino)uracil reductase